MRSFFLPESSFGCTFSHVNFFEKLCCSPNILMQWVFLKLFSFHVQPCNPAVGGPAKSQLVHEVDALGGEIGKMADRSNIRIFIRFRFIYS